MFAAYLYYRPQPGFLTKILPIDFAPCCPHLANHCSSLTLILLTIWYFPTHLIPNLWTVPALFRWSWGALITLLLITWHQWSQVQIRGSSFLTPAPFPSSSSPCLNFQWCSDGYCARGHVIPSSSLHLCNMPCWNLQYVSNYHMQLSCGA